MNLKPFKGPGSTPARRHFWEQARAAVLSATKLAGHHVSVDEHPGKGTVINVARRGGGESTGTGACCVGVGFWYGSCFDGYTRAECEDDPEVQGVWHQGKACEADAVDCVFACCYGGACTEETERHCADIGGRFLGLGVFCDDDPPPDCGHGACCEAGVCNLTTSAGECFGTYLGDGTTCDPNPCQGACCYEDGTCATTTSAECDGTFLGVGITCEENTCETGELCCPGGFDPLPGFSGIGFYLTYYTLFEYHMTISCDNPANDVTQDWVQEIIQHFDPITCASSMEILQCYMRSTNPSGTFECNPCLSGSCIRDSRNNCNTTDINYIDNTSKYITSHKDVSDDPFAGCTLHVDCLEIHSLSDRCDLAV
jgi:hypothetical protein